jgi:type I restriction enzyme, S subunit
VQKGKITQIGQFLFEREGKYKPDAIELDGLKRIDKIDFSGNFHIANKTSNTNMILIKSGDLVISGINVAKGAMAIYQGHEDVTATIHYSSYTFDETQIEVEYFKRFLKSPEFVRLLKKQVKGGIKTEIKPKHLLALEIPLPTLKEQKSIVAHFLRFESEQKELNCEITHQKKMLNKLRRRILQEAIEGKLTGWWRSNNSDVETASKLLERITIEKSNLVKDKKIKPQKPLTPITDNEKPFELPEGWIWCHLSSLILEDPRNGYSPKSVDFPTNTKTLKLGATTSGSFDSSEYKYVNEEIDLNSFLWLKNGDILIQRSNSLDHVGVSAIYDEDDDKYIYPDLMMKLRVVKFISCTYLHQILLSPFCREYFRANASGAQKSMPKINQGIVSRTPIPLCSIEEQQVIVTKVESLLALCDQLETEIVNNQNRAQKLMQAVLKDAFSDNDYQLTKVVSETVCA